MKEEITDSGYGIRDLRYGIRDSGFEIWDLGCEIRDSRYESEEGSQSQVSSLQTRIQDSFAGWTFDDVVKQVEEERRKEDRRKKQDARGKKKESGNQEEEIDDIPPWMRVEWNNMLCTQRVGRKRQTRIVTFAEAKEGIREAYRLPLPCEVYGLMMAVHEKHPRIMEKHIVVSRSIYASLRYNGEWLDIGAFIDAEDGTINFLEEPQNLTCGARVIGTKPLQYYTQEKQAIIHRGRIKKFSISGLKRGQEIPFIKLEQKMIEYLATKEYSSNERLLSEGKIILPINNNDLNPIRIKGMTLRCCDEPNYRHPYRTVRRSTND